LVIDTMPIRAIGAASAVYLLRTLVFIVARDERDSHIVLDVSVCERPPRVFPSVSARDLFGPAGSGAAIKYLDALWLRARARSAQKRGLPLAMQHTQGVVMKTGFLARASFRNKSVALETDQIETPSVRHRRPRIFAALLAGDSRISPLLRGSRGSSMFQTKRGDYVIAYALPE